MYSITYIESSVYVVVHPNIRTYQNTWTHIEKIISVPSFKFWLPLENSNRGRAMKGLVSWCSLVEKLPFACPKCWDYVRLCEKQQIQYRYSREHRKWVGVFNQKNIQTHWGNQLLIHPSAGQPLRSRDLPAGRVDRHSKTKSWEVERSPTSQATHGDSSPFQSTWWGGFQGMTLDFPTKSNVKITNDSRYL